MLWAALLLPWVAGRLVDYGRGCGPGQKAASLVHVAGRKVDLILPRCRRFQHPGCVKDCSWGASCRNTDAWGVSQGDDVFLAGFRTKTHSKDFMPTVRVSEVECCRSQAIEVLKCTWESVPRSNRRLGVSKQARSIFTLIRDIRPKHRPDGKIQLEVEVCQVRRDFCYVQYHNEETKSRLDGNPRLRRRYLAVQKKILARLERARQRKTRLLKPVNVKKFFKPLQKGTEAEPIFKVLSDPPEAAVCPELHIAVDGTSEEKPKVQSKKLTKAGQSTSVFCPSQDILVQTLHRDFPDLGQDENEELSSYEADYYDSLRDKLALLEQSYKLPVACSPASLWTVHGGLPLEILC